MIGFAMCGSYCTHRLALEQMRLLCESGREIQPIFSENVYGTDTHFGSCEELKQNGVNCDSLIAFCAEYMEKWMENKE